MKTLGYYNGKYDEIENMVVPFDDRSHRSEERRVGKEC